VWPQVGSVQPVFFVLSRHRTCDVHVAYAFLSTSNINGIWDIVWHRWGSSYGDFLCCGGNLIVAVTRIQTSQLNETDAYH